ncbi:2-carboxy-1,4-naphthoquinone phytyltransferase, chloroplastic isoform X2 [Cynara cardunculus var. scolymus]|uniref:2-carboxy-1,4-naphthoquinone phytyltransferase, chloroplastic isoform X2 n=1 Tax=Cynara cardunculus var. scolymus TaxID=59895 RepID=UPI000D626823|nr:2-carboxy-1,4-naphthoquinone phytyltransferase, chloroplastic isoform X2 [Cynara cardunculus var. scolymus]
MVPITCNRSHWRSHFHLQNTFNLTRFSPIVSLSGNLRSSSLCCSTTRSYANKNHIRSLEIHRQRRNHPIPPRSRADDPAHEDGDHDDVSKATLVWRAIKLPIYSVALVPLTVGTAAAYLQTGLCSAKQYVRLLASSVLIITWLNLSNDVYDFDTGADVNKKESVVNMIGSRSGTLIAALVLLGLGSMGLVWASVEAGNIRSILLLVSAVTCGYIYQGGSTTVERLPITATILSASLLVGITTTLILFCSHFHQIPDDKAVGKFSPLVRIGTETGSNVVKVAVISLYSLVILLGICRALPITSIFLCALTVPMGKLVVSFVADNHQDKTKIFMAKYFCVRLHAIFGVALTAGMVAARIITSNNVPQPIVTI